MTIAVDDYVLVPKGTIVHSNMSSEEGKPSTRDQVVQVREIYDYGETNQHRMDWLQFLPYAKRMDPGKVAMYKDHPNAMPDHHMVYHSSTIARTLGLTELLRAVAEAEIGSKDFRVVRWSTKWCALAHVKPAPAPQRKEPQLSVKQKMVKGSRWAFAGDHQLLHNVENPAYWPAVHAFHAQNPKPMNGQPPGKGTFTNMHDYLTHHGVTEYIKQPWAQVKNGEEFTVTGKHRTGSYRSNHPLYVPIDFRGKEVWAALDVIKDVVQELEIPVVKIFTLRDSQTGKLFRDFAGMWSDSNRQPELVTDFKKAKRFEDMNRLRLYVMGFTGYYDGLPGADNMPDWAGGAKVMDLPPTWEAGVYDKHTKQLLETIPLRDWYDQLWRLRALTVKFGSPVRTLYKTIESKGELDKYKGMLVIRMPTHDNKYRGPQYEDEISPEDAAAMADLVDNLGLKRGTYRRAKDNYGVAVAFESASVALMAKLKYQGNLRLNVINLDNMQEELAPAT